MVVSTAYESWFCPNLVRPGGFCSPRVNGHRPWMFRVGSSHGQVVRLDPDSGRGLWGLPGHFPVQIQALGLHSVRSVDHPCFGEMLRDCIGILTLNLRLLLNR